MLFAESSCVCMPSFRSVAPFLFCSENTIFLIKKNFFYYFFYNMGVGPYRYAHNIPLVTLILNIYIYGFVGVTSTVQA